MIKLFFDIETVEDIRVPQEIRDKAKERYEKDYNFLPEFHQIACICAGYKDGTVMKMKSFSFPMTEKDMIVEFYKIIDGCVLGGFNIKNFDIPFLIKRGLKHGIPVPNVLRSFGKKPWEFDNLIDLYEVYKFMGRTSGPLDSVCGLLSIPTPKDKIDGSQVQEYFDKGKIVEITEYCTKDVEASIKVYEEFKRLNVLF